VFRGEEDVWGMRFNQGESEAVKFSEFLFGRDVAASCFCKNSANFSNDFCVWWIHFNQ